MASDRVTTFWAIVYSVAVLAVVGFQLALASGAPWGELAMGGRFPGQLPPAMRVAAVAQAALLLVLALVVWVRAGYLVPRWFGFSRKAIWAVVVFGFLALVLNLITPSPRERQLWAPVALAMSVASLAVALREPARARDRTRARTKAQTKATGKARNSTN